MPDILVKGRWPTQPISRIIHIAFGPFQGNLWEMAPDQDLQTGTEQPATEVGAETPRSPRRSTRGRRGRGRRRRARTPRPDPTTETIPAESTETPNEQLESSADIDEQPQTASTTAEPEPEHAREAISPPAIPPRSGQIASKRSIQEAIEQVNQIVETLKESLEQMDEVLEVLEYFERQGQADEREIESLRRSLRQLQRPRDGGQHSHRGHS